MKKTTSKPSADPPMALLPKPRTTPGWMKGLKKRDTFYDQVSVRFKLSKAPKSSKTNSGSFEAGTKNNNSFERDFRVCSLGKQLQEQQFPAFLDESLIRDFPEFYNHCSVCIPCERIMKSFWGTWYQEKTITSVCLQNSESVSLWTEQDEAATFRLYSTIVKNIGGSFLSYKNELQMEIPGTLKSAKGVSFIGVEAPRFFTDPSSGYNNRKQRALKLKLLRIFLKRGFTVYDTFGTYNDVWDFSFNIGHLNVNAFESILSTAKLWSSPKRKMNTITNGLLADLVTEKEILVLDKTDEAPKESFDLNNSIYTSERDLTLLQRILSVKAIVGYFPKEYEEISSQSVGPYLASLCFMGDIQVLRFVIEAFEELGWGSIVQQELMSVSSDISVQTIDEAHQARRCFSFYASPLIATVLGRNKEIWDFIFSRVNVRTVGLLKEDVVTALERLFEDKDFLTPSKRVEIMEFTDLLKF